MDTVEKLPVKVVRKEKEYFIRIKRRESGVWLIRYLGKNDLKENAAFLSKQRGYTYTTCYEFKGKTLEEAARRALVQINSDE